MQISKLKSQKQEIIYNRDLNAMREHKNIL